MCYGKLKADRMRIDVGEPYGRKEPGITGGYILKIDKTASYAPSEGAQLL